MSKPRITMTVVKEESGYSANTRIKYAFIHTEAENYDELMDNIVEAVNLSFEEMGYSYGKEEIKLTLDIESFFDFYKVINARALSKRIGINPGLMAQYISGVKRPSARQTKRIMLGVQKIGKELAEIQLLG